MTVHVIFQIDVEAVIMVYAESHYRRLALGVYFVRCSFVSRRAIFSTYLHYIRTDT